MLQGERDPTPEPVPPRVSVVRAFADIKHVVALLQARRPVLVVAHATEEDRRRALDFLAGWAIGSGGELDEIGPNTVLARPPGTPPVRLSRSGIVSAVDAILSSNDAPTHTRDDEEQLLRLAAAGSLEARRRVTDVYSELASVLAMWIRPSHVTQATALNIAHDELDRLVAWPPRDTPFLVALTDAIHRRLSA